MTQELKEMLESETYIIYESSAFYIVYTSEGEYFISIAMFKDVDQSVGKLYNKKFDLVDMDWHCGVDDDTIYAIVDYLTKAFDINEIRWFDADVFNCMKSR